MIATGKPQQSVADVLVRKMTDLTGLSKREVLNRQKERLSDDNAATLQDELIQAFGVNVTPAAGTSLEKYISTAIRQIGG